MDPIGWSEVESIPRGLPTLLSPVVIVVYFEWGCPIYVVCKWDSTSDKLVEMAAEKPRKLIDWALRRMDSEHSDALDNHLSDGHQRVYVNGTEVKIDAPVV